MLDYRQKVLKDVVDLMVTKEKYGLDVSVSKTIYQRAGKQDSKEVVV
jgi:lipopolysaccharide biosynthesis protein